MDPKKITVIFIFATIIAIAGYDVWAIYAGGTEASISHTLRIWAHKYPAVTFSFGFVMGHLFWPITLTPAISKVQKALKKI